VDGNAHGAAPIRLERVRKEYPDGTVAVEELSLDIPAGEVTVLIGPSGCGKSTVLRMINRLIEPTAGRILLDGEDVTRADATVLRRRIGYVIQHVGLFPHQTVRANVGTVPRLLGWSRERVASRTRELLDLVGLDPDRFARRYPHELSGGQRQRVGLARALALSPAVIVADEAVSALDVSIRAQIINLLQQLQRELGLSYLFIAHDLAVVRHLSHRVAVMYLGQIVEQGAAADLYTDPRHPYTVSLLSAVPVPDPAAEARRERIILPGDPPNPAEPPPGCRFHTRCWLREQLGGPERCAVEEPAPRQVSAGHTAACHFTDEVPDRAAGTEAGQAS